MSGPGNRGDSSPDRHLDAEVEALLRLAGEPETLPQNQVATIRDRARTVWWRTLRRRRQRRWGAMAALVATALVVVGWLLGRGILEPEDRAGDPGTAVARLELFSGGPTVDGMAVSATAPRALAAGSVITTGPADRAALRLAGGTSVRLDAGTRLRIAAAETLVLEQGAVYVDSGDLVQSQSQSQSHGRSGGTPGAGAAAPPPSLVISTPYGRVRDVGTQFEVRLLAAADEDARLRLKVRSGEVEVETPDGHHRAGAGGMLEMRAGGEVRRGDLAAHDPSWRWVEEVAPTPAIEGQTLAAFLDWVSRERGLGWRIGEPRPAEDPGRIVLHGSVSGLTPTEALELVLTGTGLEHRLVGGELVLTARTGEPRQHP